MALGNRISERLEQLGKRPAWLSRQLGQKNNSSMAALINKDAETTKHASKIAKILGVRLEWLTDGIEPIADDISNVSEAPNLLQQVPLIGKVSAGAFVHARELESHEVETWLMAPKDYKGRAFGLKVEGDSMTSQVGKSYPDSSIAIFDSDNKTPENGQLVLAKICGSDEITFKKYVNDAGNNYLMPLNSNYPRIDEKFRVLAVFEYAIIF